MQTKITIKYHYITVRIAKIKKKENNIKCSEDTEKLENSFITDENFNWHSHSG